MSIFSVGASTPAADSAVESKSLRFEDSASSYLSRTLSVAGNRKTWTFSAWVKLGDMTNDTIFGAWNDSNNTDQLVFRSGHLQGEIYGGGSAVSTYKTAAVYRDPSAWYHVVWQWNSTEATAGNRHRIYVNGELTTEAASGSSDPSQNAETTLNTAVAHYVGQQGDSSQYLSGYLAEVNFIDGTALTPASFAETDSDTNQWKPKAAADVKAAVTFGVNGFYLPFSNDVLASSFLDTGSGSRHTVTAVGNVHTDTTIKKLGTASAQFDGTGDALTCPDSSDFTLVDAMFTLEAYVYLSNTNRQVFISKYDESGNNREFKWEYESNNMMFGYSTNGSSNTWLSFAWTPSVDTWYHIAICRDGSSTIRAFVDGTQIGSNQVVSSSFYNGSALLSIGVNIHNGSPLNSGLTGYMDEIRICNIGKYTYNFTPPTVAFESDTRTKLLLHCDGSDGGTSFTDSATHIITANGDAKNTRVVNNPVGYQVDATGGSHIAGPKFGTGCYANAKGGNAEWLEAADSADWTFGTGDFTLEGWVNLDKTTEQTLFSQYADASNRWYLTIDNRDAVQTIAMYHHASSLEIETSTGSAGLIGVHKWVHIAAVRASGVISIYVDGVALALATNTSANANMTDVAAVLQIGAYNDGQRLKGYMDELRISNSARYTSNFTPDTTAFSNDGNTKLLLHCDGTHSSTTFTDSSGSSHTVTAQGTAKILVPKIGTGSYRNNGSGNGLMVPSANCPWAEFGTGDFTVEAWVSLDDITTDNQQFFTHRNSTNSGDWILWWDATNGLQFSGSSNSLSQGGTTGWVSNTWTHIAASRASGVNKIFVNGTLVATNNSATQDYSATATLFIASYSTGTAGFTVTTGAMTGYMDEARITPGKALYTSSFTPTTTAYTDDIDTRLLMHFDGGGPGTAGSDTNVGQGQYYHDSATNAIYYVSNLPKYKSNINFDGSGDYLSMPGSSSFDFGTGAFAIEFWFWVKDSNAHTALINSANYYVAGNNGNWAFDCYQEDVRFNVYNGTGAVGSVDSTGTKIECGVWNHVAFCRDGSGNGRIFINGALSSSVSTALNGEDIENGSTGVEIGGNISYAGPGDLNGGIDNVRISKSARYTSAFTKPTDRVTSDADTVFLLNSDFTDGGLGADHSGNYNLFTPTNLGIEDMVEDSPTNNFCTLNPLVPTTPTLSEGNLKGASTSTSTVSNTAATFSPTSGKWYWEICLNSLNLNNSTGYVQFNIGGGAYIWSYYNTPTTQIVSNATTAISNFGAGDILQFAVDIDNGKAWFGNNGTWYTTSGTPNPSAGTGQAYTFTYSGDFWTVGMARFQMRSGSDTQIATCNFGQDSSFAGYKNDNTNPQPDANGKGDFYYAPPAGYLALCTDNLDDPGIALPGEYFNTVTYAGTGASQTIAVGFQPDFVWAKCRTTAVSNVLYDSVRGTGRLESNTNAAEASRDGFVGFSSNGFDVDADGGGGGINYPSGRTYVAWNWKAGTSFDPATAGTVASGSGSASATAGFSIVKYPGSASDVTVGHGLSQAPELILIKNIDAAVSWPVYVGPLGNAKRLELNDPYFFQTTTYWVSTSPTASVFTLDGGVQGINNAGEDFIAYCWHSVEGYSKIGSYTGNANADGTFVYCGFRPAYLMIKRTDASKNWFVHDNKRSTYNVIDGETLKMNTNEAEVSNTGAAIDFVSNGFKQRTSDDGYNSGTFLYLAFAESPFKTANAR